MSTVKAIVIAVCVAIMSTAAFGETPQVIGPLLNVPYHYDAHCPNGSLPEHDVSRTYTFFKDSTGKIEYEGTAKFKWALGRLTDLSIVRITEFSDSKDPDGIPLSKPVTREALPLEYVLSGDRKRLKLKSDPAYQMSADVPQKNPKG